MLCQSRKFKQSPSNVIRLARSHADCNQFESMEGYQFDVTRHQVDFHEISARWGFLSMPLRQRLQTGKFQRLPTSIPRFGQQANWLLSDRSKAVAASTKDRERAESEGARPMRTLEN